MKVEFVTNACAFVTVADGRTLLTDPWLTDGAYYGTWCNYPPLAHRDRHLARRPDFIYISHIHPDHLDPESLRSFPRQTEIWIGRLPHPHLRNKLRALGFERIVELPLGETRSHQGLGLTVFGDFAGSSFGLPDEVEYALDTSLHLRDSDGTSFFDINDNPLQVSAAPALKTRLGELTVAMLPYSGASLYPHAFIDYDEQEKARRTVELRDRMLDKLLGLARVLSPQWAIPCAGSYVMGGTLREDSRFLHQATPAQVEERWAELQGQAGRLALLAEGDILDTTTGVLTRNPEALHRNFTEADRIAYAQSLSSRPYPHEELVLPQRLELPWDLLLATARRNLWRYQEQTSLKPTWDVEIHLDQRKPFCFALDRGPEAVAGGEGRERIAFHLDRRLMLLILVRGAHWNNAEGGALVRVSRKPDRYEPTIHSLMSFFHL